MNFVGVANDFYPTDESGTFYKTNRNYSVRGISLKGHKLLLLDRGFIVDIEHVLQQYTRTMVYALPLSFELEFKEDTGKLTSSCLEKLRGFVNFTVNQNEIREATLLLKNKSKRNDESPLVTEFTNFINSITDETIKSELQSVNIDMPEYGIMGDKLFIINKDDKSISRMIIFGDFNWHKVHKSISIYYFGENLYSMEENILMRYILIFDNKVQTSVSFDHFHNIVADNDMTLNVPLKKTNYCNYSISDVRKLFNRRSFIDSMVKTGRAT